MSDQLLEGRVALVTGGSRGLGREIVRAYAAAGADVIIASRTLESCVELATEIESATGRRAVPVAADVGRWDDCDALVEAAYDAFGRVDVLVNNAGMSPTYPSPGAVTEKLWDKTIGVNLKGPFRLTASIGERMVAGDGGAIINITSVMSVRVDGTVLPYAAAKAGLTALTEGFARAFGPTVRVNAIQCGMFRTDIAEAWDMDVATKFARRQLALRRIAEAPEIVGAALFLATDRSSYCTGSTVRLDGGYP